MPTPAEPTKAEFPAKPSSSSREPTQSNEAGEVSYVLGRPGEERLSQSDRDTGSACAVGQEKTGSSDEVEKRTFRGRQAIRIRVYPHSSARALKCPNWLKDPHFAFLGDGLLSRGWQKWGPKSLGI